MQMSLGDFDSCHLCEGGGWVWIADGFPAIRVRGLPLPNLQFASSWVQV